MTETTTQLKYAVFPSRKRAREAQAAVDEVVDGEVDMLTEARELSAQDIPLGHTMARVGTILGASLVAGLMLAALAGLVWLGVDALPVRVPSPYATTAIVVMLAAILGGLAGSLSYATRSREELRRLRELLRLGHTVLLIDSSGDIGEFLRRRGAVQTGTLA